MCHLRCWPNYNGIILAPTSLDIASEHNTTVWTDPRNLAQYSNPRWILYLLTSKLLEHTKREMFYGSGLQKQNHVSPRKVNFPVVCASQSERKDNQNTAQHFKIVQN
jgi:hypothetical protein